MKRSEVSQVKYLNAYYDERSIVFVRRVGNEIKLKAVPAEASCFIHRQHMTTDLARMLRNSWQVRSLALQGDWHRVVWHGRTVCEDACVALEKKGVPTAEAAVSPIRRYCADNNIKIATPRRVFLDIETDSRKTFAEALSGEARVLCWALVRDDAATRTGLLVEDTDGAERKVLSRLWKALAGFDQVLSWNGDRFDFEVIRKRSKRLRLDEVDPRRWLWLDHLKTFQRMNMMAAESGDEKQSMALQNIATAVLGEGKDDFDASKTWEAWEAGGAERERMLRYCIKDTDLMRRIEEKTGYIDLLRTICQACGTFPNSRGLNPGGQVETFMLWLADERGYHFPSRLKMNKEEKFRGAFVMDPTDSGIVRNVHVADFAALYPSIILSWNMSPETLVDKPEAETLNHLPVQKPVRPEGVAEAAITGKWFAQQPDGLLPSAIQEMLQLRKSWNAKKASLPPGTVEWKEADRRSTAYKIAANSFYGVVGSPMSRLFNRDVAESVTQCGVWLIQETIKAAEQKGMRVVYGDTDSLFVVGCTRDRFAEFVGWCNRELYPGLLEQRDSGANHIKLAYEKEFDRVVFCTAKKYCGSYAHYKGKAATVDSKPEVKGLEFKRGDSVRLARVFQEEVVNLLVGYKCVPNEDPVAYERIVNTHKAHVLNAQLPHGDVVISKRLSRPVKGYARRRKKDGTWAAQLPHIEIARLLQERGRDIGEGVKIPYVCVDGSVSPKKHVPVEDWSPGDEDRHELWEGLVWPPTRRLLAAAFPAHDWSVWNRTRPPKPRKARKRPTGALELPGLDAEGGTAPAAPPKKPSFF